MRFRTVVERSGKTATGIEVPVTVVDGLGGGKRPAVRVTINGHTYRSSIAPMGGTFMIDGAETDETRQRRIARSIAALRQGKPR